MFYALLLSLVICDNPVHHRFVNYEQPVVSRQDVWTELKSGWVKVPVINNSLPEIHETIYSDGTIVRVFDYQKRIPYHNQKYSVEQTYPSREVTQKQIQIPVKLKTPEIEDTSKSIEQPIKVRLKAPELDPMQVKKFNESKPRFSVEYK